MTASLRKLYLCMHRLKGGKIVVAFDQQLLAAAASCRTLVHEHWGPDEGTTQLVFSIGMDRLRAESPYCQMVT